MMAGDPITDGLRRALSGDAAAFKPPEGEDVDSCVIVTSGPNEEVIVRKSDLLHCLQVAVWRAGLLGQPSLLRLKEALGIGEDESVPKPGPR